MHNRMNRGYALVFVMLFGVVLATLSSILLFSATRDNTEAKQQLNSVKAVYAAEAAVAVGIEEVRKELERTLAPNLAQIQTDTLASATAAMPNATFDTLSVAYYDALTNRTSTSPNTSNVLTTIATGPNAGLKATQTPIQVLAKASVKGASATIADAVRVDLIPIFQYAIFLDGDLETETPAPLTINGRVHANGGFFLSNSSSPVNFLGTVTSAGKIHSHTIYADSVDVGSTDAEGTFFKGASGSQARLATDLPRSPDSSQRSYLQTTFGANVLDVTGGQQPLSVPIKLSSAATCTTTCSGGKACVKVRATDATGVCMDKIVSRPSTCGGSNTGTTAEFAQSLAVEIIKRPKQAYEGDGVIGAPYNNGIAATNVYVADYGPKPNITRTGGVPDINDPLEIVVPRSVPIVQATENNDDPGASSDRMFWKADIRIIDGLWYRKGETTPFFDPENVDFGVANINTNDTDHKFARVLRYSWWWDSRESRVYCTTGGDANCVGDGNKFQRGQQIRSSDFDMAAFMALLEDTTAKNRMFAGGSIPAGGIILYMSETYDATFEDANTKLPRVANVRNYLNFPIMSNHMTVAQTTTVAGLPGTRISPKPVRDSTGTTTPVATPAQRGWFSENIWGIQAPAGFRSLTPVYEGDNTTADDDTERAAAYANPNRGASAGAECRIPSSTGFIPGSRPSSFAVPNASNTPPCIQSGATPLGAENAVRIVRATSVPSQGLTFVTDNRLYIYGDVNVRDDSTIVAGGFTTKQDIQGRISFIADSITVLSQRFSDRERQGTSYNGFFSAPFGSFGGTATLPWTAAAANGVAPAMCTAQTAIRTRINSSLMMGDVPSCDVNDNATGNKSGGINNWPRFAEDWSSVEQVIHGSMVGLFRSEQGNSRFLSVGFTNFTSARGSSAYPNTSSTCVYNAPTRQWTFDDALLTGFTSLPPGTPRVVATDRLRWIRR